MQGKTSLIASLIIQGILAIVALLVAFGVELTAEQIAAIAGLAAFLGIVATLILWAMTVPKEKVLEALVGDDLVVAGSANDRVAAGEVVRHINPRRAIRPGEDPEAVPNDL